MGLVIHDALSGSFVAPADGVLRQRKPTTPTTTRYYQRRLSLGVAHASAVRVTRSVVTKPDAAGTPSNLHAAAFGALGVVKTELRGVESVRWHSRVSVAVAGVPKSTRVLVWASVKGSQLVGVDGTGQPGILDDEVPLARDNLSPVSVGLNWSTVGGHASRVPKNVRRSGRGA
eukprot:CAMPEP_0182522592 /NCGR_PEP_ID=MMETSP1323-20130603/414_1 /TAXON_ID=236787 /ORGANISM="Florenciella parvula, Strain RCC1693" /LENGTH=172 /DNA_ID=CAMNT_0024730759 /DNA_START=277 /DNA_END=796 /DNA_ORIENTATION=+